MSKGPDNPIEDLKDVKKFLKLWRDSLAKKVPYTANRIQQCIEVLNKVQQKLHEANK